MSKNDKPKYSPDGHRKRLRNRCNAEGLDAFEEHQVLELMLQQTIQRKDTKTLAYALMNEFGSLAKVLDAEAHELMRVTGVGEITAFYLSLQPSLFKMYERSKWGAKPLLDTSSALGEYAKTLFIDQPHEVFYLICLDAGNCLIHAALTHKGTIDEVSIYPRIVVEHALRHKAKNVAFAHNHPGGSLKPTSADLDLTWALSDAMRRINIPVVDHIIVAAGQYFSFVEKGLMGS